MRSHSYSRGADNAVSPLAGRTRVAAKRDVNGFAVPSRQETLLNADSGNACARSLTRTGCRRRVRRIRIGFLPRLLLRLGGFKGASPSATEVGPGRGRFLNIQRVLSR